MKTAVFFLKAKCLVEFVLIPEFFSDATGSELLQLSGNKSKA